MDTTTKLFNAAVFLIGLHVADDNFLQPEAGTSASDHLVSGLVPLALLALAAWGFPRLSGGRQGALALFLGPLGIAAGIEAAHYANQVGPSGDDFTGFLAIPAGLLLLGLGAVTLFRTRRTEGNHAWRYGRRGLFGFAGLVVGMLIVFPTGFAYVTTHTARAVVPANQLGVAYQDVSFETSDGLTLKGWYVPSRNGAAVISFPGRKGPQKPARMLARHGYGVLVFDRRGEGESEGEPNAFGWGGDLDIKAAVEFLRHRADVDGGRIGGIGLSVGGEMMLEAAAETDALKAVVSEGAGFRSFSDEMDQDLPGSEKSADSRQRGCQGRHDDGLHESVAGPQPQGRGRPHRAAAGHADRGSQQQAWRGAEPWLLRGRTRAEDALGDPRVRARGRHGSAARRVRTPRGRLLRRGPSVVAFGWATVPLAGGPIETGGELGQSRAWSTMKVPVIVAAIAAGRADWEAIEAAITRSDNDAARLLFDSLGDGAAEVEAVLRRAGDDQTTFERERDPRGYTSFGRTVWSLPAALTFYAALARGDLLPEPDTERVLDAMGRIVPEQRWGLGALPGIRFKGGWGPSEGPDGGYEVIQVGIAGSTVIAIAARAEDFEAAKRLASKHVPQHPNTP